MRLSIVLFAFGAWLLQRQAELPDMRYAWVVIALALPALLIALVWRARTVGASPPRIVRAIGKALLAACALAAGFLWAAWLAHARMDDALPAQWEGRDVELVGVIASLPQPYERSVRFEFDVERVLTSGARVPQHIQLSWWGRPAGEATSASPPLHAAERWRLVVRLKRPHGTANPYGFDYEAWLLERGVRATGYVRPYGAAERLDAVVHRP